MKRIAIPVVMLVAIAIAAINPLINPATANQQGPGVGDQLTGWAILCDMHGGKATVNTDNRTVRGLPNGWVFCGGGGLGGLFCYIDGNPTNSFCWQVWSGRQSSEPPDPTTIDPTGAIPIVASIPIPVEVENPASEGMPPIIDAQVAWPATEGIMQGVEVAQIHACTLGGGTATSTTRLPDIESAATVRCDGGEMDAYTCDFLVGLVTCFTDSSAAPAEEASSPAQTPGSDATEAPASTSESTVSTEPTEPSMPTETAQPVEPTTIPTDEPVIEPTAPPATGSDPWTVPEGTLPVFEPAEPTPTEVILF